jgi:hypothetical protein
MIVVGDKRHRILPSDRPMPLRESLVDPAGDTLAADVTIDNRGGHPQAVTTCTSSATGGLAT